MKALLRSSMIRFLVVGVFNTMVGLSVSFLALNLFHLNYWISTFTGNTVGAVVSYVLNKRFTFRSSVNVQSSWWKFAIVTICCYFASYGFSLWLASALSSLFEQAIPRFISNSAIVLGNGIYTATNYVGHRYFTFRSNHGKGVWKGKSNG